MNHRMSPRFSDLPADFQSIKSPRFACFVLENVKNEQIVKLQQATLHAFTEKQIKSGVNNYSLIRSLILFANSNLNATEEKFIKLRSLPTLLENYGTSIPEGSFKIAIQGLEKLKLLKATKLDNPNYPRGNWKLYEFPTEQELDELISELSFKKIAPTTKKNRPARGNDTVSQNLALEDAAISRDDATLTKKHLPPAIVWIDELIPKFIYDMSPANDGPHNKDKVSKEIGGFRVEAKGHQRISTKKALMTGLMLIRIAISYNAKMLSQGKFKRSFEKREVPVFTNDLMLFKGSDSAPARVRTGTEIYMLRDTVYDITDLRGVYSGSSDKPAFLTDDFRFIESVATSSDAKYTEEDPDARLRSASLYIIKFTESVEQLLSSPKFFKVLPLRLLTENNVLVTLYLYLRSMRFSETSINYKQLVKDLPFTGNSVQLSERLQSMLSKYPENADREKEFDANFFGYHIKFGEKGMRIQAGSEEELTVGAGASYDPTKDKNTPTIPNKLYYLAKTAQDLREEQDRTAAYNIIRSKHLDKSTRSAKRFRSFFIGADKITITAYSTDAEIENLSKRLFAATSIPESDTLDIIEDIRDELNIIKSGEHHISREDITKLADAIFKNTGIQATLIDVVFHTSKYRAKKIKEWKDGHYESIVQDLANKLRQSTEGS